MACFFSKKEAGISDLSSPANDGSASSEPSSLLRAGLNLRPASRLGFELAKGCCEMASDRDATRPFARLPNLDLAFIYRTAGESEGEQIMLALLSNNAPLQSE